MSPPITHDGWIDEAEVLRRILYLKRFVLPGDARWAPVVSKILDHFEADTAWNLVAVLFAPTSETPLHAAARSGDMTTLAQALVAVAYDGLPTLATRWADVTDVDDVMAILAEAVKAGVPPAMIDWHHNRSPFYATAVDAVHTAREILDRVQEAAARVAEDADELRSASDYNAQLAEANAQFATQAAEDADRAAAWATASGEQSERAARTAQASASSATQGAAEARRAADDVMEARHRATEAARAAKEEGKRVDGIAKRLEKAQDGVRRDVIRLEGRITRFEEKLEQILARVSNPRGSVGLDPMSPSPDSAKRVAKKVVRSPDSPTRRTQSSSSSSSEGEALRELAAKLDDFERRDREIKDNYDAFRPPPGRPSIRDRTFYVQGNRALEVWRAAGVGIDQLAEEVFRVNFQKFVIDKLPRSDRQDAVDFLPIVLEAIRVRPSQALDDHIAARIRYMTDKAAYDVRTAAIISNLYEQDGIPDDHRRKVQVATRLTARPKEAETEIEAALLRLESTPKNAPSPAAPATAERSGDRPKAGAKRSAPKASA